MDVQSLKDALEEYKRQCSTLEKEKQRLLEEFEEKRSKFKEVYQAKEKLVTDQASELENLHMRLKQNDERIGKMGLEIQDLKVIASVSESTKQEAVDNLFKRHQDEMESLRRAMEESNEESQREMVRHFERERRQWEKKLSEMKCDKEALEMELDEVRRGISNNSEFTEEEELEASMKKAHAEAEKLKSVILPLENEISELKEELERTKAELAESQRTTAILNAKSSKIAVVSPKSENVPEDEKLMDGVSHTLKCEKSSRTDLERYVEDLKKQKQEVEREKDKLQENMQSVRKQFELEKAEHAVLKQTWLAANDQFLESQRLLMRDNSIIEGVLSEDQKRQAKMLKLKAQASEAREAPAKSPMSALELLKMKTEKFKEAVAESISPKSETESDTHSFGSFQDFQDAAESNQQNVTLKLTLPESKSSLLTHDTEHYDADKIIPSPGQKVVNESEWNDMLREIRILRSKTTKTSSDASISTPGKKHADLFDDDAKMTAEIKTLNAKMKLYEEEKKESLKKINSLEESIRHSADDSQKQTVELTNKLSDFERLLGNLKEKQIKAKAEDINKMGHLTMEKDKYRDEFVSLKKEHEKHKQRREKHHQTLLKELSSASKSPKESRSLIADYCKALATTKAEKDSLETKLKNEIAFLEERLKAEQSSRDQLETSLASELHDARGEIISLQSLKSVKEELEKALGEKAEKELELEKSKTSYEALQTKSSEIIKGLRDKHLSEIKAKEDLERSLAETKTRLKSLHSALETSEHVQRDFVRLSQSLQVELEQVRQEREKERKSDIETSSVQSLELAANNQSENANWEGKSPAISPDHHRKNEQPNPSS